MIYSGKFKVTSPFGIRTMSGATALHKGIDLVGVSDKHICAVMGGTVRTSTIIRDKNNPTWEWGNYVRVDGDDGRVYFYCHLSKRLVSAGKRVEIGDHLGIEGNTGYSFGSHCHFELRDKAGNSLDPSGKLGIPNEVGTYGTDYRKEAADKFGLSDHTMKYLDKYQYAADLYRKLAL